MSKLGNPKNNLVLVLKHGILRVTEEIPNKIREEGDMSSLNILPTFFVFFPFATRKSSNAKVPTYQPVEVEGRGGELLDWSIFVKTTCGLPLFVE